MDEVFKEAEQFEVWKCREFWKLWSAWKVKLLAAKWPNF
jgi:hypothetical protein